MKQNVYFFHTRSTRVFISVIITLFSYGYAYPFFDAYNAYTNYQTGAVDTAEEQYASLAANNLSDWRPLYNLGTIALNKQNYPDAVTHLEKALTLDPENKIIQERLAIAKKLRDAQKQQQQNQDSQNQNSQNQQDSQKQESSSKSSKQQEQKQNEQQSKEREQRSQQTDQEKANKANEQKGQADRKEQEKQQANNANNNQQRGDAQEKSESSRQNGQQEREKDNANNNAEQQRQEPMHGTSHQKETQTTQKKIAQAQALANDTRFSQEEKKFMEQLDKLDKQGQQQMLALALAPSQAEQQFQDHNW